MGSGTSRLPPPPPPPNTAPKGRLPSRRSRLYEANAFQLVARFRSSLARLFCRERVRSPSVVSAITDRIAACVVLALVVPPAVRPDNVNVSVPTPVQSESYVDVNACGVSLKSPRT